MGEKIADGAVIEAGDTVECTIRGCASFGHDRVNAKLIHLTLYFLRIAAVQILLDNILDYRTEIPVLLPEQIVIFSKKPLKIIKKYPIKNSVFRMTLPVDPCHGSRDVSRNRPRNSKELRRPDTPGMLQP
jgi:hypothetical protein